MPALILPGRRLEQPQCAAEVDWQSPFARGLEFLAWPEGNTFRDLVTGTLPDSTVGTLTCRLQAREGGKSTVEAARVVVADDVSTTGLAWPASDTLRGANLYDAGTLLCLGGSDIQTDGRRIYIGGNTEIVSNGNNPTLAIDSFINVARGNVQRVTYNGSNHKTSTAIVGNPFNDKLHFFGYAFDTQGAAGDFFVGPTVEAFSGATAWANASPTSRRARLFTGGSTANGKSAIIAFFGMWSRRMSAAEYRALYDNPWQLVRATPRRMWFDLGAGGGASVTLTGVASAEAFGAASLARTSVQAVVPSGIASAEAFGSAVVARQSVQAVSLSGVASAEAFGTASAARISVAPVTLTGIGSAEAFGTAAVSADGISSVSLTGIASSEGFGTAAVSRASVQAVSSSGIASAEAFGAAAVARQSAQAATLTGIASGEDFGSATVARQSVAGVSLAGVGSAEAIGSATVTRLGPLSIVLTGIASAEAFGVATFTPTGIAAPDPLYTLTVPRELRTLTVPRENRTLAVH